MHHPSQPHMLCLVCCRAVQNDSKFVSCSCTCVVLCAAGLGAAAPADDEDVDPLDAFMQVPAIRCGCLYGVPCCLCN